MHQMTENDGYHKHLSDTNCRSAVSRTAGGRHKLSTYTTEGMLDTQRRERDVNNNGTCFFLRSNQTVVQTQSLEQDNSWILLLRCGHKIEETVLPYQRSRCYLSHLTFHHIDIQGCKEYQLYNCQWGAPAAVCCECAQRQSMCVHASALMSYMVGFA